MGEIIKTIKELAHKVSEEYTLFNKDMNESLISMVQNGEIENIEILKRVCEQANNNVYLSLFHDPEVDSSNIIFDIADHNKISSKVKEGEEAMKDYTSSPKDFRSDLEIAIEPNPIEISGSEKLGELNEAIQYRDTLRNLLNRVGIMKTAEIKSAEESFNRMASDTRVLISNGDSIGDIAKIASRHIKENIGGDAVKVAGCYDLIHKDLIKNNFKVNTEFTKVSSCSINAKASILKPVEDFNISTMKIAGFSEMENGIINALDVFEKAINKSIKK